MKILLLGSGGREHALAWKISQSDKCEKLYIAPGNAGTAEVGENVNIKADDFESIKMLVLRNRIQMVVVGPEDPLVKGISDYFKNDPYVKDYISKAQYLQNVNNGLETPAAAGQTADNTPVAPPAATTPPPSAPTPADLAKPAPQAAADTVAAAAP